MLAQAVRHFEDFGMEDVGIEPTEGLDLRDELQWRTSESSGDHISFLEAAARPVANGQAIGQM
jgi:hypothetical protein